MGRGFIFYDKRSNPPHGIDGGIPDYRCGVLVVREAVECVILGGSREFINLSGHV